MIKSFQTKSIYCRDRSWIRLSNIYFTGKLCVPSCRVQLPTTHISLFKTRQFMHLFWKCRLKGLCDNVDSGPEQFQDHEICFSLRIPNQAVSSDECKKFTDFIGIHPQAEINIFGCWWRNFCMKNTHLAVILHISISKM